MLIKLTLWNDARTAALYLKPCTPKYLNDEIGAQLTRQSANRPGAETARGGGWLYHRHDLERLRAIMDALGCNASKAVWLLHGIRTLGKRAMLPHLALTLEEATKEEAELAARAAIAGDHLPPRRRFR
jgi:hypothetical protein